MSKLSDVLHIQSSDYVAVFYSLPSGIVDMQLFLYPSHKQEFERFLEHLNQSGTHYRLADVELYDI